MPEQDALSLLRTDDRGAGQCRVQVRRAIAAILHVRQLARHARRRWDPMRNPTRMVCVPLCHSVRHL